MAKHEDVTKIAEAAHENGGWLHIGVVQRAMGLCSGGTVAFAQTVGFDPVMYLSDAAALARVARKYREELSKTLGGEDWADVVADALACAEREYVSLCKAEPVRKLKGPKFSAPFKKWREVLGRDVLSHSDIRSLGHRFAETLGAGFDRTNLTIDEAYTLEYLLAARLRKQGGYRLTSEQTEQGLKWLGRREVAKEMVAIWFTQYGNAEQYMADHANFASFEFTGYYPVDTSTRYRHSTEYLPIYRVLRKDGTQAFNYAARPWQARDTSLYIIP